MPRFKVLHGAHSEGGHIYGRGSTVDSKSDLDKLFNRRGMPAKYQRINSGDVDPEPLEEPVASVALENYPDLKSMKVRELRAFAEAEEIDLTGCGNDKQAILTRIEEHLEG